MSEKNPLDPVRASHEEEYFHKRNQELIDRLRHQIRTAETARALESTTGVYYRELMAWLADLGITPDNARVLHLVPLLQIAWADGTIQPAERELLQKAAHEAGILPGTASHTAFEELLRAPPSRAYYEAALIYIRLVLAALPEADAQAARETIQALCAQVARISGGVLGLFSKVSDEERSALRQISSQLELHPSAAEVMSRY